MPLYRGNMASMPQAAQSAMNSATNAMASQQKQTTTKTERERSFWEDLRDGANAVGAAAGAVNSVAGAAQKGMELYDDVKLRSAYDDVSKAFQAGGFDALQNNPEMMDIHHNRAIGKFMKDRANTYEGFTEMMKKSDETADKVYADWRMKAIPVVEAYKKGDMQAFRSGMIDLAASSPVPYKLEDSGNGNFNVLFRSDEAGGFTPTGRTMSDQEAFDQVHGVLSGERMVLRGMDMQLVPDNPLFNQGRRRSQFGTAMANSEAMWDLKNYKPLYDRNGKLAGYGNLRSPLNDYGIKQECAVFDLNGQYKGTFQNGWDDVIRAGLSPIAPQKGKGRGGRGGRRGGVSGGSGMGADFRQFMAGQGYKYNRQQNWWYDDETGEAINEPDMRYYQDVYAGRSGKKGG